MDNYDNIIKFIELINDERGLNIASEILLYPHVE